MVLPHNIQEFMYHWRHLFSVWWSGRGKCLKYHFIQKVRSGYFKLYRAYSNSFNSSNVGTFFWSWILKDCIKRSRCLMFTSRLRVVSHFSSGILERAKRKRACKSPHTRKARRGGPFLAWGDFHARSPFARSTIPEDKWGKTRSLVHVLNKTWN